MSVICGKHKTESKVTKIPGGVQFNCAECDIERAEPALLDALSEIVGDYEVPENYDVKIYCSKALMAKAKAAIKQARGE